MNTELKETRIPSEELEVGHKFKMLDGDTLTIMAICEGYFILRFYQGEPFVRPINKFYDWFDQINQPLPF